MAIRLFLYKILFFVLCCRLNVNQNELYHDKTNKNKEYNFCQFLFSLGHFFSFCVGSKMLNEFCVLRHLNLARTVWSVRKLFKADSG